MTRTIRIDVGTPSKPRVKETTGKQLGYLFCGVFESGYSPWVRGAEIARGTSPASRAAYEDGNKARVQSGKQPLVWWGFDGVWEDPDLAIELRYDRAQDGFGSGKGKMILRAEDLAKGFKALSRRDGPLFRRCLDGDFDGPDADKWIQYVVFGKEVY